MSIRTGRIININGWAEIPIPYSVIGVVNFLWCRNKYGFFNTYNDNVIIPDDDPNDQHDDDETSNDEDDSDYVDTDSMSIMDGFD